MSLEKFIQKIYGSEQFGNFDNYTIGSVIGTGGSGKVVAVTCGSTRLAMKLPLNAVADSAETMVGSDSDFNRAYMQEAANWVHVSEQVPDAAVRMLDYNVVPFPWAVMELASGDFSDAMDNGTADVGDVICLLRSLESIHRIGIVHRDIKPENILNVNGRWKFSDFGLSKSMQSRKLTVMGMGTPAYMAPEQISRKFGTTDFRTDIWQMGILLCRVLIGHLPFEDDDPSTIGLAILTDGPDLSDVPAQYMPVLERALAQDKEQRFSSAKEFADALESAAGNASSVPEAQSDRSPAAQDADMTGSAGSDRFRRGMVLCWGLNRAPD